MKSIVIVHHTGDWGGGTKSLIDLCEMLHDEYSVTICIPKGYPEFRTKISRHGAKTHELKNTAPCIFGQASSCVRGNYEIFEKSVGNEAVW